jgi:hypothetical protein
MFERQILNSQVQEMYSREPGMGELLGLVMPLPWVNREMALFIRLEAWGSPAGSQCLTALKLPYDKIIFHI